MQANLAGTIFTLPAGDLAFAVGLENRKEEGKFVPDALAVNGASTNLSAGPTRGGYSVDEIYAELQIPILADLPFARELSLNLASRFSDYDSFGETTNNKFGLKWKPLDQLLIRGTYADGFRAPTISDLFGGGSQTFSFFTDPCDTNFGSSRDNATTRANCVAAMGAIANTYRQLGQGLDSGRHAELADAGGVHFGFQPDPDAGAVEVADHRRRVEPDLRRRPQHVARLVEDPHRRHDRDGQPDRDPRGLLHQGPDQPLLAGAVHA
jgi:iron complex outermembrane receptor protein